MQGAPVNNAKGAPMANSSKRTWALTGSGVVACAACCAPLVAPLFMGVGGAGVAGAAAGSVFGVSYGEVACAGIIGALLAGVLVLAWRSFSRPRQAEPVCACPTSEGDAASCDAGGACDPKPVQV